MKRDRIEIEFEKIFHNIKIDEEEDSKKIKRRKLMIIDVSNSFFTKMSNWSYFEKNENYTYSPYSIYSALSLAKAGSEGNTKKEFIDVLGDKNEKLAILNKEILNSSCINLANGIFLNGITPEKKFYDEVKCDLHIKNTQFPKPGERIINEFVSDITKGNITKIINEGSTNQQTRAVLINAIYFKSDWKDEFDPKQSIKDHPFSLFGYDKKNNVTMMVKKGTYQRYCGKHKRDNDIIFSSCLLPYKDNNFGMLFIKPSKNTVKYYKTFEDKVFSNKNFISDILNEQGSTKLDKLKIPKFKVDTEFEEEDLKDALRELGIKDAFSQSEADFRYISNGVFINKIKHIAKLEVDEKGSMAAASTPIIMTLGIRIQKQFILDQPFYCFVIFNPSNTILFTSKIVNPTF